MATKPTDLAGLRDKLGDELKDLYEDLEAAKQKVRGNPGGDRRELDKLKREYADKSNEYAELARSAATLAGGKNHWPAI